MVVTRQAVGTWVSTHRPAFVIAVLYVLATWVHFLPPLACCLYWERLLAAVGYLIFGTLNLLALMLSPIELFTNAALTPFRTALYTVLVGALGLIVGLVIQALWRKGRWGKAIMVAGFTLNAGVGLLLALFTSVSLPHTSCERFFSDTAGIRVVVYTGGGNMHHFIVATGDGGRTWEQLAYYLQDSGNYDTLFCKNIKSLNEQSYWAWTRSTIAVTHDGGMNWQINDVDTSPHDRQPCWLK